MHDLCCNFSLSQDPVFLTYGLSKIPRQFHIALNLQFCLETSLYFLAKCVLPPEPPRSSLRIPIPADVDCQTLTHLIFQRHNRNLLAWNCRSVKPQPTIVLNIPFLPQLATVQIGMEKHCPIWREFSDSTRKAPVDKCVPLRRICVEPGELATKLCGAGKAWSKVTKFSYRETELCRLIYHLVRLTIGRFDDRYYQRG